MNALTSKAATNRKMALKLSAVVLGMFGFGYALVPLYDVFCEITGLNGKTGVANATTLDGSVDESREVKVTFLGHVNSALDWEFEPVAPAMEVHPGGIYEARYRAKNRSSKPVVATAVPSVTPVTASRYFDKTDCFCFDQQRFEAGEERELVVRFILRRALPPEYNDVTLSYTFFKSPEQS